jgi:hypothetical protein
LEKMRIGIFVVVAIALVAGEAARADNVLRGRRRPLLRRSRATIPRITRDF